MKDTKENEQNQESGQIADENQKFSFIRQLSIEKDWQQIDEESEEVYQGF